jgi:hypothetical protein
MKNEKLIVAVLFVALLGLVVAAVFASRVAPKSNMQYSSFPGKQSRLESVQIQAVPISEPPSVPLAQ